MNRGVGRRCAGRRDPAIQVTEDEMEWTVRRRIGVGYVFSLILLVLVAVAGVLALREVSKAFQNTLAYERGNLQSALRADIAVRGAAINQLRYLAEPNDDYIQRRDSLLTEAAALLRGLRDSASDAAARELWTESLQRLERWRRAADRVVDARAAGFFERAGRLHASQATPIYDANETALGSGTEALLASSDSVLVAAQRTAARWELWLIIAAAVALAICIFESILVSRAISRPLGRTATALASDSAEILEVTVQQTWASQQAAQAAARAARRFDDTSGTQAQALRHAEKITELAKLAAETSQDRREETLRKLGEEAARIAAITRHRVAEIRDIEEAVVEANEAAQRSAATTRQIETAARKVNAQGMRLLRLIAPRRDGKAR